MRGLRERVRDVVLDHHRPKYETEQSKTKPNQTKRTEADDVEVMEWEIDGSRRWTSSSTRRRRGRRRGRGDLPIGDAPVAGPLAAEIGKKKLHFGGPPPLRGAHQIDQQIRWRHLSSKNLKKKLTETTAGCLAGTVFSFFFGWDD